MAIAPLHDLLHEVEGARGNGYLFCTNLVAVKRRS